MEATALTETDIRREILRCSQDPVYFLDNFCCIYDGETRQWIPFKLWQAQAEFLDTIHQNQFVIALKARQLGFSWLVVGYALWTMIFRPIATVLIFSKGDSEAVEMLDFRLEGMERRLPDWLRIPAQSGKKTMVLENESRALSFPTTGGRSYTATLAIVDEADRLPPSAKKEGMLAEMLDSVKPTVDAGGKLILISTTDKSKPQSLFKKIYRAAKDKKNGYVPVFHGWNTRPERSKEWYDSEKKQRISEGRLVSISQEYPSTDKEALDPETTESYFRPAGWPTFIDIGDAFRVGGIGAPVVLRTDCMVIVCVDWATSERTEADDTAIGAFALTPDERLLVLDMVAKKVRIEEGPRLLAEVCRRWRPDVVASDDDLIARASINECRRYREIPEIRQLPIASKPKLVRCTYAITWAGNGRILRPVNPQTGGDPEWWDGFASQLVVFDGEKDKEDDMADVLGIAVRLAESYKGFHHSTAEEDYGIEFVGPKKGSFG